MKTPETSREIEQVAGVVATAKSDFKSLMSANSITGAMGVLTLSDTHQGTEPTLNRPTL